MTPIDFYSQHVDRSVVAALGAVTDVHLCKEACVVLNSFVDYWWNDHHATNPAAISNTSNPGALRSQTTQKLKEFGILRDVAESHKHAVLHRPNRTVTSTDQTKSKSATWNDMKDVSWNSPAALLHSWESADRMVIVDADDGSSLPVIEVIVAVDQLFRRWLNLPPRLLEPYAPRV